MLENDINIMSFIVDGGRREKENVGAHFVMQGGRLDEKFIIKFFINSRSKC